MMKQNENEMNFSVPLEIIKASEIEPKEVKWLWYPYIPFGKVTLLQGDPGDGKSKLMLSIAALLSKGEPLPFTETEENEPMTIIYQTTEDDADDTVVMLPPCLVPSYRHRPMMNSHRAFFIYRRILNEQYRNQHRYLPDCQKADRQNNLYRPCPFQPDRKRDDGGQNQASAP